MFMKVTVYFNHHFRAVQGQPFFTLEVLVGHNVTNMNFARLMVLLCGSNSLVIEVMPLCILQF